VKTYNDEKKYNFSKYWRSFKSDVSVNINNVPKPLSDNCISSSFDLNRRSVLKLMGASFVLAGIGVACRRPESNILPYVKQPEEIIPGIANYFATAMSTADDILGLVVESHEGRPTKIEGNKLHLSNSGSSDIWSQSSVLQLYDPDRSKDIINRLENGVKKCSTWKEFKKYMLHIINNSHVNKGKDLAFLINHDDSPTLLKLKNKIDKQFPLSSWYKHDQMEYINTKNGAMQFFGKNSRVQYHLKNAKIIFSLQSDMIMSGPEHLRHANEFATRRRVYKTDDINYVNRLYVAESGYSVMGANADHRIKISMDESSLVLQSLMIELFKKGLLWPAEFDVKKDMFLNKLKGSDVHCNFISELANDIMANLGNSLIVIGESQSTLVHALSHMINIAIKGKGKTFSVVEVDEYSWNRYKLKSLCDLNTDIMKNKIQTLVILDSNPVYDSSKKLNFSYALSKVANSIHLGLYDDETASLCTWHVPKSHFLESWGDVRSYLGENSIIQPMISPLHHSKSKIEILSLFTDDILSEPYHIIQNTWMNYFNIISAMQWKTIIHNGNFTKFNYKLKTKLSYNVLSFFKPLSNVIVFSPSLHNVEVILCNDYSIGDGRFANISWLQEMPDPITKLTWGNALYISPKLAKQIGLKSRLQCNAYYSQIITIKHLGEELNVPTFVVPGINDYSLILPLGYGRSLSGNIGNNVGANAYRLLLKNNVKRIVSPVLKLTNDFVKLASTQEQYAMNGEIIQDIDVLNMFNRDPARDVDLNYYRKNPNYVKEKSVPLSMMSYDNISGEMKPIQLTGSWPYHGNKWGMVIDLNTCIGCNACAVACQAENNIPVVGKDEVQKGRMMQWLRIDRYFTGDVNNPITVSQPVPCMHCENAPCEPVCPVAATVHDEEGLNSMAYNRCIGTRYCANNCPYKVRRFNYFDFSHSGDLYVEQYHKERDRLLQMQKNPNVTIRYRGVMEKCTYCTQRISKVKSAIKRDGRNISKINDLEVIPACAQSCPTHSIIFGNLNDKSSKVYNLKMVNRNYDLLDELNVRPRTSYLSKLRNFNYKLV